MKIESEILTLMWSGPYKMDEFLAGFRKSGDYGVYQIYGTHTIYGPDALLNVGKAQDNSFGERIPAHKEEWTDWEASDVDIYIGRLAGFENMNKSKWDEWAEQIDRVDKLLIYYVSPPYCSMSIKSLPDMPPTVVLNYKKRKRLPGVLSSLYDQFVSKRTPEEYK